MEIKINKEIRNYTESMFFGLNARQCICFPRLRRKTFKTSIPNS